MLVFTDLGNDYINPHEATRRVNATVIPELAAIALMALLHLFAFDPLFLLLLLPVVLLKAQKFRRKQLVLDVTDIFSRVKAEKVERYAAGARCALAAEFPRPEPSGTRGAAPRGEPGLTMRIPSTVVCGARPSAARARARPVRLWLTIGMAINFVFTVVCVVDVAIGAYEFRHSLPDGSPGPRAPAHHHHGQRVING